MATLMIAAAGRDDLGEAPTWPAVLAELVRGGEPVPPTIVLVDLVAALSGSVLDVAPRTRPPALPVALLRRYEDHVAGRLATDGGVRRAADAIARWSGPDADRATAFAVATIAERVGGPTWHVSREVVGQLAALTPAEAVERGWRAWDDPAIGDAVLAEADAWIDAFDRTSVLLTVADLTELETGLAVHPAGGRVALRRVVGLRAEMLAGRDDRPRPRPRREAPIATTLPGEAEYPVGGYASLSNQGTLESLLTSELAYMRVPLTRPADDALPPSTSARSGTRTLDLFDLKWARGELTYYSRDEDVFLRPETVVAVWLDPRLAEFRDRRPGLAASPLLAAVAWATALAEAFTQALSGEGLTVDVATTPDAAATGLREEWSLLRLIHRDAIDRDAVTLSARPYPEWGVSRTELARRRAVVSVEILAAGGEDAVDPPGIPEPDATPGGAATPAASWRVTVSPTGDIRWSGPRGGDRRPGPPRREEDDDRPPTVADWAAALDAIVAGSI